MPKDRRVQGKKPIVERNDVHAAFELLLEEIEQVANSLNDTGAEAFKSSQYEGAKRAIEMATRLADFRDKVKALQEEWKRLLITPKVRRRRRTARLPKGLRTPEDAYRLSILEILVELGGKAALHRVLKIVEIKMAGCLNEYDRQSLPSNPKMPRWQNAAQWCRNTLVKEGLLRDDSPTGIWEISDKGREALKLGQV